MSNITIIDARQSVRTYWRDLWDYRELFWFMAWRDFLVRYKQTAIGIAWSVIRPLLTLLVFTVVFGRIAALPAVGGPYPVMVFTGLLPWLFFSYSLSEGSNSLVTNQNMVSKVYFPRIILPTASTLVCFVDLLISLGLLLVLMLYFHALPTARVIFLPLIGLACFAFSWGLSVYFSALNVKYRDFRYVIPFIVQLGMYVSPVGFTAHVIPERWRLLFYCNPMAGIIDGFRWALLQDSYRVYVPGCLLSTLVGVTLIGIGVQYFRKTERYFADVI